MTALRNFNGLASWRNAENSLQSVNLTMSVARSNDEPRPLARRIGLAATEWSVSNGQHFDVHNPCRRHGRAEHQAAVHFECSAVEVRVSQSVAPRLEKFVDQTGNLSSCEAFIDGEVSIHCFQSDNARNGDLDYCGSAIPSQEFLAIRTEKVIRHVLVEFGAVCEVVIEAVDKSAPGKCQMHLPLPASGLTARPIFFQCCIQSVRYMAHRGCGESALRRRRRRALASRGSSPRTRIDSTSYWFRRPP